MKLIFLTLIACLVLRLVALGQNENSACPKISVVGPTSIIPSHALEPMFFTVSIEGKPENLKIEYAWIVSAGKILEGQGSKTIKVDVTGLVNQNVEARVEIKGLPEKCANTASETGVVARTIYDPLYYSYGKVSRDEEAVYLDNVIIQLKHNPDISAYFNLQFREKATQKLIDSRLSRIIKHFAFRNALKFLSKITFVISETEKETTYIYFDEELAKCGNCKIIKGSDIDVSKFTKSKKPKK